MRILRVIPSMNPKKGGPNEGIRRIDEILNREGHSTSVVCMDPPGSNYLSEYSGEVVPLGVGIGNYSYHRELVPWIRRNRDGFDAVIVNGIWQYHSVATRSALVGGGTPYFVFTHGMLDPWFKRQYPLKHVKKMLYWPWADYRVLRDAKGVIFTCEEERVLARESFARYTCTEYVTSYGTSPSKKPSAELLGAFYSEFPSLKGKRFLLFLSRIHEKKGCDILIKAFLRATEVDPDLSLVIAGPDDSRWAGELKALVSDLGLGDKVFWPGMLQGDVKWGAFCGAECFVLPSHQENFGIVVAEALACGTPVIISNKVNIWREILEDEAGIVDVDDLDGTERSIRKWIGMSKDERSLMRLRARACFERRFHIEKAANKLIDILMS